MPFKFSYEVEPWKAYFIGPNYRQNASGIHEQHERVDQWNTASAVWLTLRLSASADGWVAVAQNVNTEARNSREIILDTMRWGKAPSFGVIVVG